MIFSCLGDYLSKFKTLRLLCIECNIKMKEQRCIYLILSMLGNAYSMFVSTFYAMRESLGKAYEKPTLESFCASLIREDDKLGSLPGILHSDCHSLISLLVVPTQYLNTTFVTILLPCLHEWLPCIQLL